MRGFTKIVLLVIVLGTVSTVGYFMYLDFQIFQKAKIQASALTPVDSTYQQLKSYKPVQSTHLPPIIQSDPTVVSEYVSPFSPCVSLQNDRNWEIYASSRHIFPENEQLMLYDRFWNVVWLGLKPKGSEIVDFRFYGPFRFDDVPERSYIEYLLIGRDVSQKGGAFQISLTRKPCK